MLLGIPQEVKRFFDPIVRDASKPIRQAVAPMILAFLLAPHNRRLKTIAGMVLGHRVHVGTISRRLVNPAWTTQDWCDQASYRVLVEAHRYERPLIKDRRRKFVLIVDATLHSCVSEKMENLLVMSKRKDSRRRSTKHHVFVMGLMLTESGARIPLKRRSYYTKEYCKSKGKPYRTQTDLVRLMIAEAPTPPDADVTVVYDSAYDADKVHSICRERGFREVFPIDPNRNLSVRDNPYAPVKPSETVVASTLEWPEKEFETLELEVETEGFAFFRRRHVDNLRVKKTFRRYVLAARSLTVSKLGRCLVVASYKENPKVELLPGQSKKWSDYRREVAVKRKKDKKTPTRWLGKVLACTDPHVAPSDVIQWYEVRWQIELFFRELKSRMQFGCYVLMKFEAVERYLDLLLMGFIYLEKQRLNDLKATGKLPQRGDPRHHARTTDRLRNLEETLQRFNLSYVAQKIRTKRGQAELLAKLKTPSCRVA